jgi:hypothetical protein
MPAAATRSYGRPDAAATDASVADDAADPPFPRRNWTWAALMRRAFALDVLACPAAEASLGVLAVLAGPRPCRARTPPGSPSQAPRPLDTRPAGPHHRLVIRQPLRGHGREPALCATSVIHDFLGAALIGVGDDAWRRFADRARKWTIVTIDGKDVVDRAVSVYDHDRLSTLVMRISEYERVAEKFVAAAGGPAPRLAIGASPTSSAKIARRWPPAVSGATRTLWPAAGVRSRRDTAPPPAG